MLRMTNDPTMNDVEFFRVYNRVLVRYSSRPNSFAWSQMASARRPMHATKNTTGAMDGMTKSAIPTAKTHTTEPASVNTFVSGVILPVDSLDFLNKVYVS